MGKKLLLLLMILLLTMNTISGQSDQVSGWAKEAVDELKASGYIEEEAFVGFKDNITREEFIYLAVRVYEVITNSEIEVDTSISFKDTDYIYALKGASIGITSGVGNNKFDPQAHLTREQLAVMMVNTLKLTKVTMEDRDISVFSDESSFASWSKEEIYIAKANNIIQGTGNNNFSPKANASREVALIITNRMINNFMQEIEHPTHTDEGRMIICYDVYIDDFESGKARVELNLHNIDSTKIIIRNHGYHGYFSGIESFNLIDEYGQQVSVGDKRVYDVGFGTNGYEWTIYPNGSESLKLSYEVDKGKTVSGQYKGYIGNGFGLFTGEQLIGLYPSEGNYDEDFHVMFHVPKLAKVMTPWEEDKGVFYPNRGFYDGNQKYVDKEDNMMQSTIAVGDFSMLTETIGETELRLALPKDLSKDIKSDLQNDISTLISYYNTLFGKSIGDYYMLAYSPNTHTDHMIWAGEWSLSQGTSIDGNDYNYTMIAHQLFHRWNGWTWGWYDDKDSLGPLVMEGNNRYYEAKSMIMNVNELKLVTNDEINYLSRLYNDYKSKYQSGQTIKYIDSSSIGNDTESWTAYNQGALIWFLLDLNILEDTNGKVTVDDLMESLDDSFGRHKGNISMDDVKSHLLKLTGNSYSEFFDDYVYGSKYLDLEEYFEDEDKDGYPNYYEILRATDPLTYTNGAPTKMLTAKLTENVLVVGSREHAELFSRQHGLGNALTGSPSSGQITQANMIILLNDSSHDYSFGEFQAIEAEDGQIVVKNIDGVIYVYIKAENNQEMLELINGLDYNQLFIVGVH